MAINYNKLADQSNDLTEYGRKVNEEVQKGQTLDPNAFSKAWERKTAGLNNYNGKNPRPSASGLIGNLIQGLKTQESGGYYEDVAKSVNVSTVANTLLPGNKIPTPEELVKGILDAGYKEITSEYQNQKRLLEDINTRVGLTGQLSKDYREEIVNASPRLAQLGVSYETLADSARSLIEASGRFNVVNQQTFERAAEVGQAFLGDMKKLIDMVPEFEKVGIGTKGSIEAVERAGKGALELGLNSVKVGQNLKENIGKLNEYGFRNGVDGLARMVQKSIEFRLNMNEVFKVADKVFEPESAVELTANLQALGGAIGDFNDPLKLMYMATNNVEGLQDAIIDAASSLATYNQEQGKFEITGVNLRRAREMAKSLGIEYGEFAKTAIATQERLSAKEMLSGLGIKDEDKEFLTNLSQMKDGKMSIDISGSKKLKEVFSGLQEVSVDNLTEAQAQTLLQYREEFKELSSNQIVRNQATDIENIRRDMSFLVKSVAVTGTREIRELAKSFGIDFQKAGLTTEKLMPKIAESINKEIVGVGDAVKTAMQSGKVEAPKASLTSSDVKKINEEKEKTATESTKNIKITNDYNFKGGPALVDGWMREVVKDSSIYKDFFVTGKNEYTEPEVAKK
jgi:hypothetical protein